MDRTRVIAIMILCAGGALYSCRYGFFQTYGARAVGLYAGLRYWLAVRQLKATTVRLFLEQYCFTFCLLFTAGKNIFGDAAVGEYFRVFISYSIIALAIIYLEGVKKKDKQPEMEKA